MKAYLNDTSIKDAILAQLQAHAEADEIIKGQYWEDGKGCAVGCTVHSGNHAEYEPRFGIPQVLARLEDCIFEGLPNGAAKAWPLRFMGAIRPGQDLSLVGWKFLHWILTDNTVNPGIDHPLVREAIKQCADVLVPLTKGALAEKSASSAAWSAVSAARSAAESAAWSAARSAAESAAWSAAARSAASAAESAAWSAAWSAASAAESAASAESAAESAASAAESAEYEWQADTLLTLLRSAR